MYEDPGVFEREGGLIDHRHDPGGVTNYGISLRFLRSKGPIYGDMDDDGDVDADDIRALTEDVALELYHQFFWLPVYDQIDVGVVAVRVFDHHVNAGQRSAGIVTQRACRAFGHDLKEDGVLGPESLKAINACTASLLWALKSERAGFYRLLAARNSDFSAFIKGWLMRAYH